MFIPSNQTPPTLELRLALLRLDSGHVVLLGHRLGQHALQPLQGGLALLGQRRQALVTRVEGRNVTVTKLCGVQHTPAFGRFLHLPFNISWQIQSLIPPPGGLIWD